MKYTGCPCSTLGTCYTTKKAEACGPGETETDLTTECCGAPFMNNGCSAGYGFHETRTCVSQETPVIALSDGSRSCPDKFFKENTNFPVCYQCDGVQKVGEGGGFLSCYLPYSVNSNGDCFAYDSSQIGWFNQNGDFKKGGSETILPQWQSSGSNDAPVLPEFPTTTSSNAHAGAGGLVGVGAAAVFLVGGFAARKRSLKNTPEKHVQMTDIVA